MVLYCVMPASVNLNLCCTRSLSRQNAGLSLSLTLSLSLLIGAGVAARDLSLFLFRPLGFTFGRRVFYYSAFFCLIGRRLLVSGVSCWYSVRFDAGFAFNLLNRF